MDVVGAWRDRTGLPPYRLYRDFVGDRESPHSRSPLPTLQLLAEPYTLVDSPL